MNALEPTSVTPAPRKIRKRYVLLALFPGFLVAGAFAVAGVFWLGSHTRGLRDAVVKSIDARCDKKFAVRIGGFTTGFARVLSGRVKLPPELRAVAQALHGAEVAVYELERGTSVPERLSLLEAADREMQHRGWVRIVAAMEKRQLVAVYIPEPLPSSQRMRWSVVVLERKNLVIASVRADLEPVLEFARTQMDFEKAKQADWIAAAAP